VLSVSLPMTCDWTCTVTFPQALHAWPFIVAEKVPFVARLPDTDGSVTVPELLLLPPHPNGIMNANASETSSDLRMRPPPVCKYAVFTCAMRNSRPKTVTRQTRKLVEVGASRRLPELRRVSQIQASAFELGVRYEVAEPQ